MFVTGFKKTFSLLLASVKWLLFAAPASLVTEQMIFNTSHMLHSIQSNLHVLNNSFQTMILHLEWARIILIQHIKK